MTFRKILFWVHLTAGIISGLSVAIMCFTGTVLVFEKEITAWSERDARRVTPPSANAARMPLDELQRRLREAHPDARPSSIVVYNDPGTAVAFSAGRTAGHYVNPYTGEVRQPASAAMGRLMQEMVEWHRYLNFGGEASRPRGKWINGACNLAFCLLAMTGLYLWMPRAWSWRALRPIVWFRQNATAKARDFNWHNAIGFWTAPVLIILTLTAVPISFRWGGNLIYTLTRTPAPEAGGAGPGAISSVAPAVELPPVPPATRPATLDALFAAAQKAMPEWQTITLRTSAGGPGGGGGARSSAVSSSALSGNRASAASDARATVRPVTLSVRERGSWPRTATTTLILNPYTGDILRRTGYADMNAAQQVRSWTRFLHTGEAVGWLGQLVAGIACLGGMFLVYTGFALSWRRFFGRGSPGRTNPVSDEKRATLVDAR